jgi:hypothetical protein
LPDEQEKTYEDDRDSEYKKSGLSFRQDDKTQDEPKPQRKLGDPVPEHERKPKPTVNLSEIKKKEQAEAAARRALFRKPTEEMKEVQNTMLRKFLSKFQPKRLPNLQKIAEESKQ